jgi:peptidoglycan/LPS O-acetylase OafA/YrhL
MTQWFGILTYAVYVVHEPIYNTVRAWAPDVIRAFQSLALVAIAVFASILIAIAAYIFVERPFAAIKQVR